MTGAADSTVTRSDGTIRAMAIDLGDPTRWRDTLPSRQPASSEVAAGAIAGLAGGATAWGLAMAVMPPDLGALYPLRLVAATFFGAAAVEPGTVGWPAFVGALLAGLLSVAFGLVFVSILRPAATLRRSMLVGAVYGAVLFLPAWYAMVLLVDPLLFAAGKPVVLGVLALHVVYGTTVGFLVPFLRKILPSRGAAPPRRSVTRVAPHPPASSPAARKASTSGWRRRAASTVRRSAPVPFPCTMRTSPRPASAQASSQSATTSAASDGWNVCRSRVPSMGRRCATGPI